MRYPLRFEVCRKEDDCQRDKISFKTKIQPARELIDRAVEEKIPFQTVIFDSRFFCKELTCRIESYGKDWISLSKANRKLLYKGRQITCQSYADMLTPLALPETNVKGSFLPCHPADPGRDTIFKTDRQSQIDCILPKEER